MRPGGRFHGLRFQSFKRPGNPSRSVNNATPAISLGLILLGAACAHLSAAERITVELRPGEGVTCAELTTPRPWTVPSDVPNNDSGLLRAGGFHRAGADFEFRQGEKLLVSIFTGSRINLCSPDKYAVIQQNSKLALTPATEVEWQSGRVLPRFERHVGGEAANGQPFPMPAVPSPRPGGTGGGPQTYRRACRSIRHTLRSLPGTVRSATPTHSVPFNPIDEMFTIL